MYCRKDTDAKYIKKVQNKKLKKILKRAYSMELYRKKFEEVNLTPKDILSVDDLHKLPSLTKEEYRDYINEEVRKNPQLYSRWLSDHTSGSTGMPLITKITPFEHAAMMGKVFKVYMSNGHHIFTNSMFAIVSPTHSTSETHSFIQKLGLARKYKVSQLDPPQKIVESFNCVKPDLLNANMSHIISMIEYAEDHNIKLYQPNVVITTAEKLSVDKRRLLEKHFGEAVVDVYGCIETGMMAYSKKGDLDRHYFLNEYNYFFVKDSENKISDNGDIYITSLFQKGFPLINYKVGDKVETYTENGIRYIKEVFGRSDDWIKFKDGTKVPFQHIYEIMSTIEGVIKFRVVQETYDLLIFNVVKIDNDRYKKDIIEHNIMENARKILPLDKIRIEIHWKETIDIEKNGKIRMLISKV